MRIVWALVAALGLAAELAGAQKPPQRIISVIPAITEMLFALGAGDRVVAVGSFDRYPPQVEKLPKVGALLDPDLERMLSLRPDLVAVYGSQTDLRKQLEGAGIPIFVYSHGGLAGVSSSIRDLGARIGAVEQAGRLTDEISRRLQAVKQQHPGGPAPRTLVVMGRDSLALRGIYASGGFGFIHDMLTAAGGANVLEDLKQEAVQATTELILARRPEVIIELRAERLPADQEAKERAVWNVLASVPAVRNDRIHLITDRRTVIPGPRVAEGVEIIARALHSRQ
jgi:iron complex transport system substrate-binding protein